MDAKYVTTAYSFRGSPSILSWVTMYTIRLSFISCRYVVKVKVVRKVKPLLSGHLRDFPKCPLKRGRPLYRGL